MKSQNLVYVCFFFNCLFPFFCWLVVVHFMSGCKINSKFFLPSFEMIPFSIFIIIFFNFFFFKNPCTYVRTFF